MERNLSAGDPHRLSIHHGDDFTHDVMIETTFSTHCFSVAANGNFANRARFA
jgi:hypothetical protein